MATLLILLFCSVLLIVIGSIFSASIIKRWGGLLLWILMIVIAAFRYDGSDVTVYQSQYYLSGTHDWFFWNESIISKETAQPLFFYLNKLFYTFDLGFSTLRFWIELICMLLSGYIICLYTKNWAIVYLLYFAFPFYADLIQTRNYIMSIFVLVAVVCMSKETALRRVKTGGIIALSGLFHSLGFMYLPFILIDKFYKSLLFKMIMIVSLLSPLYIKYILNNSLSVLFFLGLQDTPLAFYMAYAEGKVSTELAGDPYKIFMHCWVLVVVCTLFIIFIEKQTINKYYIDDNKKNLIKNTKNIWLLVALFLPAIGITPSMERLPRNLLLPFYISLGIYLENVDGKISFLLVAFFVIFVILYGGVLQNIDSIIEEVNCNYVMDMIDYL